MIDIKILREDPNTLIQALIKRGAEEKEARARVMEARNADETHRATQTSIQALREERNALAARIPRLTGDEAETAKARAKAIKGELAPLEETMRAEAAGESAGAIKHFLENFPNIPHPAVPDAADGKSYKVCLNRGWYADNPLGSTPAVKGEAYAHHRFDDLGIRLANKISDAGAPIASEVGDIGNTKTGLTQIGEGLGRATGSAISGARFSYLRGAFARLERALVQFMLELHTGEHRYAEVSPPLLVRGKTLFGSGHLPKFADDQYKIEGEDLWLIPTAEVVLAHALAADADHSGIVRWFGAPGPIRIVAATPCFRREAGAAGKDTAGIIRQHQFTKVELVSLTAAQYEEQELEDMTGYAEKVLQLLELPYRVVELCGDDLGFAARRTYDLEVWMAASGQWREISSCSMCGDFQARRMNLRWGTLNDKSSHYFHTLNGSGVAVGRAMAALLEQNSTYNKDGWRLKVPEVLRQYFHGKEELRL